MRRDWGNIFQLVKNRIFYWRHYNNAQASLHYKVSNCRDIIDGFPIAIYLIVSTATFFMQADFKCWVWLMVCRVDWANLKCERVFFAATALGCCTTPARRAEAWIRPSASPGTAAPCTSWRPTWTSTPAAWSGPIAASTLLLHFSSKISLVKIFGSKLIGIGRIVEVTPSASTIFRRTLRGRRSCQTCLRGRCTTPTTSAASSTALSPPPSAPRRRMWDFLSFFKCFKAIFFNLRTK